MIREECSKLPDNAAIGRNMNYILDGAVLVGGSEEKFDGTSNEDYAKLGAKKCEQVNKKHRSKNGRTQEVEGLHEVISFHTDDKITPELARDLALSVWRDVLDIDNHRHRWAVHTDTDEIHVHLSWNKRDNSGKIYNQKNDYELFEKALHKMEVENGLKVVTNRKFLKPRMPTNPQGPNEYRLENRGIKSEKTKFKEAVNASTDKAMTAGEFLEFLDNDGFTLITNGNNAYSIEKDGVIFKASDVGASYKALKARFGDDPQFYDTLERLGVKTAPVRDFGGISVDFYDEQSAITERRIKSNRVLDTRFDTDNDQDFYFKNSNKKAFEFDKNRGRVAFNSTSPLAIKAGLQKLTENGKPQELTVNGPEHAKRQIWLQFHMMNLDQKGYSLAGFTPTSTDKAELEKMKLEAPTFKKSKGIDSNIDFDTSKNVIKKFRESHVDLESFTQFKISDTKGDSEKEKEKASESGPAGLLEGLVKAMTDLKGSFTGGIAEEQLSQMRVLDQLVKNNHSQSENEEHETKKRRLQKLKPQ